jgi:hypothetical protein
MLIKTEFYAQLKHFYTSVHCWYIIIDIVWAVSMRFLLQEMSPSVPTDEPLFYTLSLLHIFAGALFMHYLCIIGALSVLFLCIIYALSVLFLCIIYVL